MMEVVKQYTVPYFPSDWQATFIERMDEFFTEAAIEVISNYKEMEEIDGKDDDNILAFALEEGLFDKIAQRAKENVEKYFREQYE